ncbi:MAG TPA: YHS domain-containing protein [Gemmatimonadales bacterium]|nr:YHS domain-containing protein [Gemmatimonadales bacterium]
MAQVQDPVCGMMVDEATAVRAEHQGRSYRFCSEACRTRFEAEPDRFAANRQPLERHEPPFTTKDGITAPKFGSAGSGGAELEPGPERHGRR